MFRVTPKIPIGTSRNTGGEAAPEADNIYEQQRKDRTISDIVVYIKTGELPIDKKSATELLLSADSFYLGEDKLLN